MSHCTNKLTRRENINHITQISQRCTTCTLFPSYFYDSFFLKHHSTAKPENEKLNNLFNYILIQVKLKSI